MGARRHWALRLVAMGTQWNRLAIVNNTFNLLPYQLSLRGNKKAHFDDKYCNKKCPFGIRNICVIMPVSQRSQVLLPQVARTLQRVMVIDYVKKYKDSDESGVSN